MNEIMPVHLDHKVTPKISGPSPALIVLLEGELAQKVGPEASVHPDGVGCVA